MIFVIWPNSQNFHFHKMFSPKRYWTDATSLVHVLICVCTAFIVSVLHCTA